MNLTITTTFIIIIIIIIIIAMGQENVYKTKISLYRSGELVVSQSPISSIFWEMFGSRMSICRKGRVNGMEFRSLAYMDHAEVKNYCPLPPIAPWTFLFSSSFRFCFFKLSSDAIYLCMLTYDKIINIKYIRYIKSVF